MRQTMGLRIDDAVAHWWQRHPWAGKTPAQVERAVTARVADLIAASGAPDARRPGRPGPVPASGAAGGGVLGLLRRGHRGRPGPAGDRVRGGGVALGRVGAGGQAPPRRLPVDGGRAGGRPHRLPRRGGFVQRCHLGQGGPDAGGGGPRAGGTPIAALGVL